MTQQAESSQTPFEIAVNMEDSIRAARDFARAIVLMTGRPNGDDTEKAILRIAYELVDHTEAIEGQWERLHASLAEQRKKS